MTDSAVATVRAAMRKELVAAMKSRSAEAVSALRTALAAIDNAEAVPAGDPSGHRDAAIAGATSGVGSSEAARRVLSIAEVRAVLDGLVEEYTTEAQRYLGLGRHDDAEKLQRQAQTLRRHV